LAVLAFHGGLLPGGFLGVDAFLVLSGYLITALLVREHERSGRIRLGAFWARRARRLLPALLVVVIVVCAVSRALLPTDELTPLRGDAMAALGYLANWRMILRGNDYFAQMAVPSPLQHTWSQWTHLGDPEFDAYVRGELDRAVGIAASRGARVVVCTEPYNHRAERPDGRCSIRFYQPYPATPTDRLLPA
jgi:hypothetical protein